MHPAQIIQTFMRCGDALPVKAIQWCRDNWDAAAPTLLRLLNRYAGSENRTRGDADALFFILHLCAERRETRAFASLCRLALDRKQIDRVLSDAVTQTLGGMFIGTYDGDPAPLKAVIETSDGDDMVRAIALEALAYLTAEGRFPMTDMEAYLRHLHRTMPLREGQSIVWYAWVLVVALLDLEALDPEADELFARGAVPLEILGDQDDYHAVRAEVRAQPDLLARFARESVTPIPDMIAALSRWAAFRRGAKPDEEPAVATFEQAVTAFATAGDALPVNAMLWCRDNWEAAAPGLIDILARYADGTDRSERATNAVLFILHLAAERGDTRALEPACRLAHDNDALEDAIGDTGVTESLPSILIGVCGDDPAPVKALIEDAGADEFVRNAALEALGYLTAAGRLPLEGTAAYLAQLFDTLRPQAPCFVWAGWAQTVCLLRLEALAGRIDGLFDRGLLIDEPGEREAYLKYSAEARANADLVTGFTTNHVRPIRDAIEALSDWASFRGDAGWDDDENNAEPLDEDGGRWALQPEPPAANPFRHVGRNDPCPCGSGKKFKKCCLGVAPA